MRLEVPHVYGDRNFLLSPYTTIQEKEILLLSSFEIDDLDRVLAICDISNEIVSKLSECEKKAMLYKLRCISVGDELKVRYMCSCGNVNEPTISVDGIIENPQNKNDKFIDQYEPLTEDNFDAFLGYCSDDLDIDEYEKLYEECENSIVKFNFKRKAVCPICKKETKIDISKNDFVVDNMSEDTLISIYQLTSDMVFHGKYTKTDIDGMMPFERTIFVGLLNKKREELNK